jgi:riboflavin kinase/FMN adenylyltransferase
VRIIRHYRRVPESARGAVVAIGNFDGVHLGHQAVIAQALRIAAPVEAPLAALTFEPHPREVLGRATGPFRLTPIRIKVRQIAALGVDYLFLLRFDTELAAMPAPEFVAEVLAAGVGVRHVVVGYDFAFGRARQGDVALLRAMAAESGYDVTQVAAAGSGARIYSASKARDLLRQGDMAGAAEILGRYWEIEGRVGGGERRGHQLGFPTANLAVAGLLQPVNGVYATWAGLSRGQGLGAAVDWRPSVANLGWRPTFDGSEPRLEVHLFDFSGDLYGRWLRVRFVETIRPERKFDGIDSLKAQIAEDCQRARAILASNPVDGPERLLSQAKADERRATS